MSLLLSIALRAAQSGPAATTFDLARSANPAKPTTTARCDGPASPDEIIVCGSRRDRNRLPLPLERQSADRVRGEAPTGLAALTPPAPCGMFAGERRCTNSEAAAFGYGNGRDPVTVLTRVVKKIAEPDAE